MAGCIGYRFSQSSEPYDDKGNFAERKDLMPAAVRKVQNDAFY